MRNRELVETLLRKGLRISSAESMTGGMFAKYVTDVPGASGCFEGSFVTYSNAFKAAALGVRRETLERFGAISEETAREMADGLFAATGCEVCVAVTGNAGPDPAEGKPVGAYYVGLRIGGETLVFPICSQKGERNAIREDACERMFALVLEHL